MTNEEQFDERIRALELQVSEAQEKINVDLEDLDIRTSTRTAVKICLAALRQVPWESSDSKVRSMILPAQQNLARALIELDK